MREDIQITSDIVLVVFCAFKCAVVATSNLSKGGAALCTGSFHTIAGCEAETCVSSIDSSSTVDGGVSPCPSAGCHGVGKSPPS